MEFLDQLFFSNTIKSYLVAAGIILFTFLLKRLLSRYIVSLLYRLLQRVWKTMSRVHFVNLVIEPLEWFLVILATVFTLDNLNFPSRFDYTIYDHSISDVLARAGSGIIIIAFVWLVLRLMDFVAIALEEKANLTPDMRDNQLIVFFRDFLKVIITIGGLLLIIKACFNQPLGNLLTGLSIVGAALALGAKESLENLIASFIIFFDKPFFSGDTVKVNNIIGTVEKIGLRSTRIRTGDQTLVTVPNKQMVDSVVDNWSMRTQRRAEIKLELSVKTPLQTVKKILEAIRQLIEQPNDEIINGSVFLKELSKSGAVIVVEYFTNPIPLAAFDALKQSINISIKTLLEENDVQFTGDISTVLIQQDL